VCLETEDGDIVLLGLVQLTELATELVLGNVCAVGVEDIAVVIPSDSILLNLCARQFLHLHDHLTTSEERVADELARAQSNLRVGHVGKIRPAARQLDRVHKCDTAS
jgi:hypothetical protein